MKSVPVITGATATGKTDFIKTISGIAPVEVISADAFQVYKYMDIGTDKPSKEDLSSIKYHLIDCFYPDEDYSAGIFFDKSERILPEIISNGRLPVVAGGTGFYVETLTSGISEIPPKDSSVRQEFRLMVEKKGVEYAYEILSGQDPEYAEKISGNDKNRIIRALEVHYITGKPLSSYHKSKHRLPCFSYDIYVFYRDRNELYDKINRRVEEMFSEGWVNEVENLLNMGYYTSLNSFKAIGYRDIADFLEGSKTLDKAKHDIKKKTRNFAKRQITWFRHMENVTYIKADDTHDLSMLKRRITGT